MGEGGRRWEKAGEGGGRREKAATCLFSSQGIGRTREAVLMTSRAPLNARPIWLSLSRSEPRSDPRSEPASPEGARVLERPRASVG